MDVVTIRLAEKRELTVAADYWNAIVKEAWNEDWDRRYPNWRSMFLSVIEERMSRGLQRYYVAEAADRIVGVAGAQIGEAFFGAIRGYVEGVYVVPAFRRKGVASRLMRECIGWLRSMACDSVRLQSTSQGKPLYESLGFVATGEMELSLNAAKQSFAQTYGE
ncbi:MAG: GNAT family N-acetyltransferase [Candidatus Eremiobacteraeota bacterium]|nr:GNAT family N-acetyltransferase [Candidatus Eremiobacteraeota bacterium]MBV8435615.1 GNAT family N-acetyltransferase [Candidatus Eremiobacteraeota bacterium]